MEKNKESTDRQHKWSTDFFFTFPEQCNGEMLVFSTNDTRTTKFPYRKKMHLNP